MALVDDVHIIIQAGSGGNGAKVFLTTPGSSKRPPDGGSGGRGGDIYFQGSTNISDLSEFRFKKEIRAEDGQNGQRKNLTGKTGKDTTVLVPLGTTLVDEDTDEFVEISENNQSVLAARGGRGGLGNYDHAVLQNKKTHGGHKYLHFQPEGERGESRKLHLILNLIADIGLIGLPNAGKSSLLNALTNAEPKIGNYPFTTLEPNLGVYGKIVLADIPGLIEGASQGKGLGISFLKHIEKTGMLLHCIDASSPDPLTVYNVVREEFNKYNPILLEKEEIILLTKIDLVDKETLKKHTKALQKLKRTILPISVYEESGLKELKKLLDEQSKVR